MIMRNLLGVLALWRNQTLVIAALVFIAGIYLVGVRYHNREQSEDGARGSKTASGYVDSAACAECHSEIAETYRLTGMGRSFYRPRSENPQEDYKSHNSFYHQASDRYYTLVERGGQFFQRRHQIGMDGKETNVVEVSVDLVIGSGNHARSYLHRSAEGKLMELPLSWYADKGGHWAMSPGYDRSSHPDFRRAIATNCIFCHNGYPTEEQPADQAGTDPVFSSRMPEGIDCQRCHGPGQAHIAAARAAFSGRGANTEIHCAIVNPARLDRDRQLEVCLQCHLETTSSPLPYVVSRYDRAPFSYRPGEPLSDYFIFFDHAAGTGHDEKFEIAGAAYRLRKSACFQQSQMTCITCHDPHDIPRGREAVQHYVKVCQSCHPSAHTSGPPVAKTTAGNNCLDCHMPKRRAEDAVHVVMTDHFIQRRRPARDLLAPLKETADFEKSTYRGEVALYYPLQLPSTGENEPYLAIAQVQQTSNLKAGIPRLEQALERYRPERPEFYFELARAYSKAGNNEAAIRWNDEALRRDSNFRPALKELASSFMAGGQFLRAAEMLERAIALRAADSFALTDLGNAYLRQEKIDEAKQVLQKALNLDPDLPEANNLMGLATLQRGDPVAGEMYFRNAIRIRPDLAEAQNNLANLLASRKEYTQAAYHFEKAIASNQDYVEAHHSYGIVLVLMGSHEKAIAQLQDTVRLAPNLAQAHSDLGDVLATTGRIDRAVEQYMLAIQSSPADYEAHLALGTILARKGSIAEARIHFERAAQSTDPAIRQAAVEALGKARR
jgi:tetratricopeptide (TPR) repeat protein